MLILDEPTSGVDPVARDGFWEHPDRSRRATTGVTIFVSTHFMNEAERCDRISLMHAGRVLASDTPAALIEQRGAAHAGGRLHRLPGGGGRAARPRGRAGGADASSPAERPPRPGERAPAARFDPRRMLSLRAARGAGAAARPDPATLALARQRHPDVRHRLRHQHGRGGSVLRRARPRPDHDQPRLRAQSRRLALLHRARADHRLRRSRPAHARRASSAWRSRSRRASGATWRAAGRSQIGAWIDGAMPFARRDRRAATSQGMHAHWLARTASRRARRAAGGGLVDDRDRATATTPTSRAWSPWCRR